MCNRPKPAAKDTFTNDDGFWAIRSNHAGNVVWTPRCWRPPITTRRLIHRILQPCFDVFGKTDWGAESVLGPCKRQIRHSDAWTAGSKINIRPPDGLLDVPHVILHLRKLKLYLWGPQPGCSGSLPFFVHFQAKSSMAKLGCSFKLYHALSPV